MTRRQSDAPARARIRTELSTNMLVEAGAGSGKTTLLVARMLEHVRVGTPVERLAAVTFTRKAASELRERFQIALEMAIRGGDAQPEETERYERALHDVDRAFLGTIHAFCGRLVREHPLDVGLDPDFAELTEDEADELRERFWRRWVERARRDGNPDLAALASLGVDPSELAHGFEDVVRFPDVEFPVSDAMEPDAAPCRRQLERLLERARELMPREEPPDGWDKLMRLIRRLEFRRKVTDWNEVDQFCAALETLSPSQTELTQRRWAADKEGKAKAKALAEDWLVLIRTEAAELLRCWRERRYPVAMRELQSAARDFERERHATGQLTFEDLLLLAARLLRDRPAIRDELGARHAHLLVDEFQDTDPVQAEVCFLLASQAKTGNDWRTVIPRAGSLFVVGDPKQSIYRFRRADIQVYEFVKARIAECGAVLALTTNFRSVSSIEAVVNGYFETVFPARASAEQAAYSAMETQREPEGADGVYRYCLRMEGRTNGPAVAAQDARAVAGWIARRIETGSRRPGDFLILTPRRKDVARYARALAARNVPASTAGAPLPREYELRELLVVLGAIADPENAVAVAAALEGLFFGLSPADLWYGARAGLRFAITHAPATDLPAMGRALAQLHEWWSFSQRHPADVLLDRILDDTGLLYHAASAELGEARAGALLHVVSAVRASSVSGAGGLTDVMTRLELLLASDAADAPLRPGRTDAVRVMNLHKAKGLEAEVVILAAPLDHEQREPSVHVARDANGKPTGGLLITCGDRVLAQPPGWDAMQQAEERFTAAERERLLYVAVTRAKRELIVSQCETNLKKGLKLDASPWRPLAAVLEEHSLRLQLSDMEASPPPGRRVADVDGAVLHEAAQRAAERVRSAAAPGFTVATVTSLSKAVDAEPGVAREPAGPRPQADHRAGAGIEWGRAVHKVLEGLGSGRRGPALDAYVGAVARAYMLDAGQTAALARLVARVQESAEWKQLTAAGSVMVEMPVMRCTTLDGVQQVTEGVVDAAALGDNGWVVVDWKSDIADEAEWRRRREAYERQVLLYAEMLEAATGRPARGVVMRALA